MSAKLMGEVWELQLPHNHQSVLLAFADHANDEGYNAFPGTGYVAWKTGYSERQVQRIIDELEQSDLLVEVEAATGRRPTVYRVVVASGVKKSPYVPKRSRDKLSGRQIVGATSERRRGDTVVSPEPSKEPPTSEPFGPSALSSDGSGGALEFGIDSVDAKDEQHASEYQRRAEEIVAIVEPALDGRGLSLSVAAVVATLADPKLADRDQLGAAGEMAFWLEFGRGAGEPIRTTPAQVWRKFARDAVVIVEPTLPVINQRKGYAADWGEWVRDFMPADFPTDGLFPTAAAIAAAAINGGGHVVTAEKVLARLERHYGPYRPSTSSEAA